MNMKAILSDSIRLLRNKWFYLSSAFTAFLLWFDFGASGVDMDLLRYGEKTEIVHLMTDLLSGRGNLLSLPLLSVLPCSASVCKELSTGVARYAVFYCGYGRYVLNKITALLLSALLSQFAGLMLFCGILSWAAGFPVLAPAPLVVQRLLVASCFAMLGNISALLTKDMVSAYVIPVVSVFALSMFRWRFFFDAAYMDPMTWLSAEGSAVPFAIISFLSLTALSLLLTTWEVRSYV